MQQLLHALCAVIAWVVVTLELEPCLKLSANRENYSPRISVKCNSRKFIPAKYTAYTVLRRWESGERSDKKYVKPRTAGYNDLDKLIWEWFTRAKNTPVSGTTVKVVLSSNS